MIRSKIDACLAEIDAVSEVAELTSEFAKIREDRLPVYYKNLLLISKALLMGKGSGIFLGNFLASSQILFTANLFERYSAKLFSQLAPSYSFVAKAHPRGTFLFHRERGGAFEQIPDILLSDFLGNNKIIIDTKWKNTETSKKGFGISAADLNQVIVYGMRYNCSHIVMLYPDVTIKTGSLGMIEEVEINMRTKLKVFIAKMPFLSRSPLASRCFIEHLLLLLKSAAL